MTESKHHLRSRPAAGAADDASAPPAGLSWGNRVQEVRRAMQQRRVDTLILTALDEIAWLLNIRGRDLPHSPLLTSYVVLGTHDIVLYVDRDKVPPIVEAHLKATHCTPNRLCTM